jgi:Stress responsive A/B Barrel Domain
MIRHIVLVRFSPETSQARIDEIFVSLHALKQIIPGILAITIGPNVSPEGLGRGYTHGFTVDFTDVAARDRYLADPDHGKVGAALVAAASGGIEGLVVLDYPLP